MLVNRLPLLNSPWVEKTQHKEGREFELTFRMDTLFDGESKLDKMTFKEEKHCECVCVIFVGS